MDVITYGTLQGLNPSATIRHAHGLPRRDGGLHAGALIAGRFRVERLLASGGMGNIYSNAWPEAPPPGETTDGAGRA